MNSEDLIHHMAGDFADYINDAFGSEDPADEYTDPIREFFGESLTQESVLAVYNSTAKITKLSKKLQSWKESKELKDEFVKNMLKRTIINNFGRSALSKE